MPPKQRITKEMIIEAAFNYVKEHGLEGFSARSIAEALGCSTQPLLYWFATLQDIREAAYHMADDYHTKYLLSEHHDYGDPVLNFGMNYIRFAIEERNLFCFLFQSNEFAGSNILDLLEDENLQPVYEVLQKELEVTAEECRSIFKTLFIFTHGYASLYANNSMTYDEENIVESMNQVFYGAIGVIQQDRT